MVLVELGGQVGEEGEGALQNAEHRGDGKAVVGKRHAASARNSAAMGNLAGVQHAAAAVDNSVHIAHVLRKIKTC